MAEAWTRESSKGTRTARSRERGSIAPLWIGLLAFLVLALLYVLSHAALGRLDLVYAPQQVLGLTRGTRFDLVEALLIAYTLVAARAARRGVLRDVGELLPNLRLSGAEPEDAVGAILAPDPRAVALTILCGAAVGLALEFVAQALGGWSAAGGRADLRLFWGIDRLWSIFLNVTLFALLARMAYGSLSQARRISSLGRTRTRVRLLDPESRRPFARAGLRHAILWLLGSSIASLLVFAAIAPTLVVLVLIATLTIGIAALILPARGIHEAVADAKRRELAWVRRQVEAERDALAHGPGEGGGGGRLPALLAYEERIAAVREWPFDASTLARFALFLLLPLGSWVGGALVERLVDLVLAG